MSFVKLCYGHPWGYLDKQFSIKEIRYGYLRGGQKRLKGKDKTQKWKDHDIAKALQTVSKGVHSCLQGGAIGGAIAGLDGVAQRNQSAQV